MSRYNFAAGSLGLEQSTNNDDIIVFADPDSCQSRYYATDARFFAIAPTDDPSQVLIVNPIIHFRTNTKGTITCNPELHLVSSDCFDSAMKDKWRSALKEHFAQHEDAVDYAALLKKDNGGFRSSGAAATRWSDRVLAGIHVLSSATDRWNGTLFNCVEDPTKFQQVRREFKEKWGSDNDGLLFCLTDPTFHCQVSMPSSLDGAKSFSPAVQVRSLLCAVGWAKGKNGREHILTGGFSWHSLPFTTILRDHIKKEKWTLGMSSLPKDLHDGDIPLVEKMLLRLKENVKTWAQEFPSEVELPEDSQLGSATRGNPPVVELMGSTQQSTAAATELPGTFSECRRAELEGTPALATAHMTRTHGRQVHTQVHEIGEGGAREPEADVDTRKRTCGCKCM